MSDGYAQLVAISGLAQAGEPGAALPDPIIVSALDAFGDPVVGVSVAAAGDGSVDATPKVTGGDGTVSFTWTLAGTEGVQLLTFTASGYEPAIAYATAVQAAVYRRVRSIFGLGQRRRAA